MVRKLPALLAALLAAIGAGALAVTLSSGSSHREAPLSSVDPTADDTDVYAFKAPDAPNALTIVANWIPFEDPGRRPELLPVRRPRGLLPQRRQHRRRHGSTCRYRFKFKTKVSDKNSFLYALPGVSSIHDPKLNVQQTYSVVRETYRGGSETGHTVLGTDLPVAPNNVGPKTFPNYAAVAGAGGAAARRRRPRVRRPGRRPVLRRPRHDLRRDQHPQRHRQRGRRQGRPRGLQRALGRAAGPRVGGHARPASPWPAPKAAERRRRRVGVDEPRARRRVSGTRLRPEHEDARRTRAPRARTTARSRSAAWATRWSTRSSSRSGRRTSSTRRSRPTT